MLIVEVYHFPTWVSLGVITLVLTITIVASLRAEKRDALRAEDGGTDASPPRRAASRSLRLTARPTPAPRPTDAEADADPAASSQPADVDP